MPPRKLSTRFEPGDFLASLLELAQADDDGDLPPGLAELGTVAGRLRVKLENALEQVEAAVSDLEDSGLVDVDLDDDLPVAGEVHADIVDLLEEGSRRDRRQASRALIQLLNAFDTLAAWDLEVDCKLGGRCVAANDLRDELEARLAHNLRGERAGHRDNRRERPPRKAYEEDGVHGQWGDLDDDSAPVQPDSNLGEAADFFLAYTQVSWPCDTDTLKRAYWAGAQLLHPDKNLEDSTANARFQLFAAGYESCRVYTSASRDSRAAGQQ